MAVYGAGFGGQFYSVIKPCCRGYAAPCDNLQSCITLAETQGRYLTVDFVELCFDDAARCYVEAAIFGLGRAWKMGLGALIAKGFLKTYRRCINKLM